MLWDMSLVTCDMRMEAWVNCLVTGNMSVTALNMSVTKWDMGLSSMVTLEMSVVSWDMSVVTWNKNWGAQFPPVTHTCIVGSG